MKNGGNRCISFKNSAGAVMSPMDSWLTLRGIKTLAVRMDRHESNAGVIAQALARHPAVGKVYYPGLPDFPQRELALKQMGSFGALVSFTLGSQDKARRVLEEFRLFCLAESLGGVESLACHPASMTHAAVPPEVRAQLGIGDDLVSPFGGIGRRRRPDCRSQPRPGSLSFIIRTRFGPGTRIDGIIPNILTRPVFL